MRRLVIRIEEDDTGRWRGAVPQLPGVRAEGQTRHEAVALTQARVLRLFAERLEQGEQVPEVTGQFVVEDADEAGSLGQTGAALAGVTLEAEDFSDWEEPDGADAGPR